MGTNNSYLAWLPEEILSTINAMAKKMAMVDTVYKAITVDYDPEVGKPTYHYNEMVCLREFRKAWAQRHRDTCCKYVMKAGPDRGRTCGEFCFASHGGLCIKHLKRVDKTFGWDEHNGCYIHGVVVNGVLYKNHCRPDDDKYWVGCIELFDKAIEMGVCDAQMRFHIKAWSRAHGMSRRGWCDEGILIKSEVDKRLAAM